jgi:hypothetical protein
MAQDLHDLARIHVQVNQLCCAGVSAYVGAAKLPTKLGVTDLPVVAVDRAPTIVVKARTRLRPTRWPRIKWYVRLRSGQGGR